jgi:hypothetical protein
MKKGDWHLGEIKGVVKEGQSVKVQQVVEVEGDEKGVNLWAQAVSVDKK